MRVFLACCAVLLSVVSTGFSTESELHLGKFSSGDLAGWKEQTIWNANKTGYSFVPKNGKKALMAKSVNSASGLINRITIDPRAYPLIKWSWKIDHTVKKGNERVKEGHDFAARVYVVFSRGFFARTRAIEYVWGNVMRKGEIIRSPYSGNVAMIAVDAGAELAGQWVAHTRNYADDYRAAFGEEAPKVGAIAIMTDSDNTHESAVGYYGDISLLPSGLKNEELKPKGSQNGGAAPKEQPHNEQTPKNAAPKEPANGSHTPVTPAPLIPAPAQP